MLTREQYAAIVEHAPIMIWRADPTGACDYVNERWLNFRGRTLEQEKGEGWSEGVHPDDRHRCLETWRAHLNAQRRFEMDYRLQRHDGEYCWIHDAGAPAFDAGGRFTGFIGSCIELTLLATPSRSELRRELKNLRGLLSLCSWCRRVQDDRGAWQELDRYLAEHSSIGFTHGICPTCVNKQNPDADIA